MLSQIHNLKIQSLLSGNYSTVIKFTSTMNARTLSYALNCKTHEKCLLLRLGNGLFGCSAITLWKEDKTVKSLSSGFCLESASRRSQLIRARRFSNSNSPRVVEGNEKALPWLAKSRAKNARKPEKMVANKTNRSSWEESADKFLKGSRGLNGIQGGGDSRPLDYGVKDDGVEEEEVEEGQVENIDDPRWDKIKNRFDRIEELKPGSDRPEFRKWNKHENWGKKTWREATESSVPKIVGETIYGVGPVLAALSAGRREFYALYVQEGIDLSKYNKKKKDKQGFEKVLRMADKFGLSQKEVSKHDLNMVADNRPHQGLVLDASPLEMVGIKELEPVSLEEESGLLWLALDEVTDPQNLGAIIRSAYFFGASGVVLCAKNSAPLSGVVSKASAGSLEIMELRSCKNMMQFLTSSANNGWRVLGGSVSSRAVSLNEVRPGAPTILVLGSEGKGLRPLVERSCTQLISIPGNAPMSIIAEENYDDDDDNTESIDLDHTSPGQEFRSFLAVESLNVSVAAGVLLHHLTRSNYSNNGSFKEANLIQPV